MLVLLGILLCASMVQSSGLDKALVIIELNTHYREAQVKRLEARVGVLEKERSENETTIRIHTGLFATCSANLNNEIGKNEKLRAKVDKLKDKVQKLKMTVQKFQSKKDKPSAIISTGVSKASLETFANKQEIVQPVEIFAPTSSHLLNSTIEPVPTKSKLDANKYLEVDYDESGLELAALFEIRKNFLKAHYNEGLKWNLAIKKAGMPIKLGDFFNYSKCHDEQVEKMSELEMKGLVSDMKRDIERLKQMYKNWLEENPEKQEQTHKDDSHFPFPDPYEEENVERYTENGLDLDEVLERKQIWLNQYYSEGRSLQKWLEDSGANQICDYFPFRQCYFTDLDRFSEAKMKKILQRMKNSIVGLVRRIDIVVQKLREAVQNECLDYPAVKTFLSCSEINRGKNVSALIFNEAFKALKLRTSQCQLNTETSSSISLT